MKTNFNTGHNTQRRACALVVAGIALGSAQAQESIFDKGNVKWADVVSDDAAGTVAAAGMLGIAGDAVVTVENVKGLVMSLKGLNSNGSKGTLALGIAPARTAFTPMNLSTYASGSGFRKLVPRLLGATTLGYAQGNASLGEGTYERRALSIETSYYLRDEDDPILAVARALSGPQCQVLQAVRPLPVPPMTPTAASASASEISGPVRPQEVAGDDVRKRAAECTAKAINGLAWNRSIASLSLARGWIRNVDGSTPQRSMGTTLNLGLIYGFNPGIGLLSDGAALALGYRLTRGEPVLSTLADAAPTYRNTGVTMLRLTGGSSTARVHLEASNARNNDVTEGHRAFKRAIGLDMRVAEGMWLNIRAGRQRSIDGSKNETGSMLSLSYSPKALLQNVGSAGP